MADERQSVPFVKELMPEIAGPTTVFGLTTALLRHRILATHVAVKEAVPIFFPESPPDIEAFLSRTDVEATFAALPPQIRFIILNVDALSVSQEEVVLHSALFDRRTGRVYDPAPAAIDTAWSLRQHMRKYPLYGFTLLLPLDALEDPDEVQDFKV